MTTSIVTAVASAAFAVLNCFFGYRLRKIWMSVWGFLIGAVAGALISAQFLPQDAVWPVILAGLAAGAVLALAAYKIYLAGMFLFGGGVVFLVAALLMGDSRWALPVAIVAGLAAGVLTVKFTRTAIIVSTSFGSAIALWRVLIGLEVLQPLFQKYPATNTTILLACLFMAVAGMLHQTRASWKEMQDGQE